MHKGGDLLKVKAFAKINLMLDILGKTEDGYHSLFMIMQSVGIFDVISIVVTNKPGEITISCSNADIPCDKSNIAYKAAESFFSASKSHNPGIHIHIEKHIPHAAGLAGGSADGAAVIYILNKLIGANLDIESLCAIGVKVGADVPFCLKGGTMAALDIGEVLAPLPPMKDNFYVLVKPDQNVSTKEAYDAFDKADRIRHTDKNGILRALATGDEDKVYPLIQNVFEQFVEVPDRVDIKSCMRKHNALAYCMSGSGPTVYGIFDTEIRARSCENELSKKYNEVFVCKPVNHGIEEIQ